MTWLTAAAPGDTAFARTFGIRPELYADYQAFEALFWTRRLVDPVSLELCRLRIAQLLGCVATLRSRSKPALAAGLSEVKIAALPRWATSTLFSAAERACLGFAEQFLIDPHAPGAGEADTLRAHLSPAEMVALTEALAIFEGFDRFRLMLDVEPSGSLECVVPASVPAASALAGDALAGYGVLARQPELLGAFLHLYGTLWSHGVLDEPTKEIARIRNARITDCGYCRNVRFAGAKQAGLGEDLLALVDDDYETSALSARQKLALRWTDAFLAMPCIPPPELRDAMLTEFTPPEIVELTAGLALFRGFSKIAIALGQAPRSMPVTVLPTPDWPH